MLKAVWWKQCRFAVLFFVSAFYPLHPSCLYVAVLSLDALGAHNGRVTHIDEARYTRTASAAGILLGIGLGGFVDGIVLHQILQWHNMMSNWVPPTNMDAMSYNMVWDGVFHAGVWLVTFVGVFLLWSAAYRRAAIPTLGAFIGQLFLGWGLFNLVEGIIDLNSWRFITSGKCRTTRRIT